MVTYRDRDEESSGNELSKTRSYWKKRKIWHASVGS